MLNKVTEELRYVEGVVPPEDGAQRCKRSITVRAGGGEAGGTFHWLDQATAERHHRALGGNPS